MDETGIPEDHLDGDAFEATLDSFPARPTFGKLDIVPNADSPPHEGFQPVQEGDLIWVNDRFHFPVEASSGPEGRVAYRVLRNHQPISP